MGCGCSAWITSTAHPQHPRYPQICVGNGLPKPRRFTIWRHSAVSQAALTSSWDAAASRCASTCARGPAADAARTRAIVVVACWRRCRFEPHADRRLSHGKRAARGVRLEFRRALTGSPQTRRMAQIGIGANSPGPATRTWAQVTPTPPGSCPPSRPPYGRASCMQSRRSRAYRSARSTHLCLQVVRRPYWARLHRAYQAWPPSSFRAP